MSAKLKTQNGYQLYAGLVAGIENLFEFKKKLDEINVYPVPDGDTGTNMCFTLQPIIEECKDDVSESIDETLQIIADKALESARGNSGTIIAQFLHGMRRSCENKDVLNIPDFAKALENGFKSAKASLLTPEEGTIITVMDDVATKAKELAKDQSINFEFFFDLLFKRNISCIIYNNYFKIFNVF